MTNTISGLLCLILLGSFRARKPKREVVDEMGLDLDSDYSTL